MFEKSKYNKLKNSNEGLHELCIYLPKTTKTAGVKDLQNLLKTHFNNGVVFKGEMIEVRALCEEFTLEERMGEIMDCAFSLKGESDIKITVNDAEYII